MADKFNPFRPGKVVTPGMFCGRFDEIRSIEQGLFQTKHSNPTHFLIEGERGIGKSSLFLLLDYVARGHVTDILERTHNFVVVNIELREAMGHDDIIDAILLELKLQIASLEAIKELCKNAWNFLSRFQVAGISFDRSMEDRPERLDELTSTLVDLVSGAGDQIDGILILIDEADKPSATARLGELCKLLSERLVRKGCDKVCIGLAGLPGLITKLRESHESSPRVFNVLTLNPLEPHEQKDVLRVGLEEAKKKNGFDITITDSAQALIVDIAEGYPHFLQEFAHCAFEFDGDNVIDEKDVYDSAFSENGALHQLGKKYFTDLYISQIGSEDYRKVLNAMAESLDDWVTRPTIISRSKVKERIVDNALHALKERNIIQVNPRVRGEYRLPTKSFAVWIRANETAKTAIESHHEDARARYGIAGKPKET